MALLTITTPRGSVTQIKNGNGAVTARLQWDPAFGARHTQSFLRTQAFIDSEVLRLMSPYTPLQTSITEHSGALSAVTNDVTYIRSGPQNVKTGTTRTINLTGDRYAGDAFQDALLAHKIKYGTGKTVIKPYVYFCMLTGKGEQGLISIVIDEDPSGAAGSNAGIKATLTAKGTPAEYTYSKSP